MLSLAVTALLQAPAMAADDASRPVDGGGQSTPVEIEPWRFTTTGYAWLMGVTGNVSTFGQTIDTNANFIDLVQKSNTLFGLMSYFEADRGPAGVYLDVVYTKLNFSAAQAAYRNPLPALRISTSASAALTYELFVAELGGMFELRRWSHGEASTTSLDALLAFRYWNNTVKARFDADANFDLARRFDRLERSFGLAVAGTGVVQWVDPVIGLRLKHQFTPRHEMMARADIGGFGLGSQFSWQAVAAYGYTWQLENRHTLSAMLGFRALSVAYSQGWGTDNVSINELMYGPIVGLSYRL
jgi:hypothetical protein